MLKEISLISIALLTAVLLSVGGYFTYKTEFFQIKRLKFCFFSVIKSVKNDGSKGIKSLFLALGGTVGVGNIAGVATAIKIGGAGSVFWMMICGIIGMITKYAEVYLSVENAPYGPFTYIKKSLGKLSVKIFSISCIVSALLIGNIFQIRAVSETFNTVFNANNCITLILILIPVGILAFSRGEFIKNFSMFTVPIMSLIYIILLLIIIFKNFELIPAAVIKIFSSAFGLDSLIGGGAGYMILSCIRQGVSKGLFSHEAGIGSSPISYSNSGIDSKVAGYMGIIEVLIDTCVICFLTAIALIVSGFSNQEGMFAATNMFIYSFGKYGGIFLAVSVFFFSISSIAGWMYYYKKSVDEISKNQWAQKFFSYIFLFTVPISFFIKSDTLWNLCDIIMLVMALPNMFSVMKNRKIIINSVREVNVKGFMFNMSEKLQNRPCRR